MDVCRILSYNNNEALLKLSSASCGECARYRIQVSELFFERWNQKAAHGIRGTRMSASAVEEFQEKR
jgi:ferredoxin-like protein FixX